MTSSPPPLAALFVAILAASSAACGDDPCQAHRPGTVCAVAGTGEQGFNRDGKSPGDTDFFLISRARRGPDGLLYFVDFNNWRIRRLDPDDRVRTVAGNGVHGFAFPGVRAIESPLDNPIDLAFDTDGRMIFVSFDDPRVLAIENGIVRVIAGTGDLGTIGNEGDGGDPIRALFMQLDGLAVAQDGTIYVSDSKANRIRMIRDDVITTVAGTGEAAFAGDGGLATNAALHYPTALSLDAAGNLYVADSLNHVVRRIDTDGVIETVAGTGESGLGGDGAPAVQARLNEPNGLAIDAEGTMYIADRSNHRVRRVSPAGIIETLAGSDEGYSGDGGPALDARFGFLARVTLDADRLLVADQSNGCIRSILLE